MHNKGYSAWCDHDAYGKRTVLDDDGSTVKAKSSYGQTRGFTGYALDEETGLYYARSRMYSAGLGRFISRDPIGYIDGENLYRAFFVPCGLDWEGTWTYVWTGTWTEADKDRIRRDILKAWYKAAHLRDEIDQAINKYKAGGSCYDDLVKKLQKLRELMAGISEKMSGDQNLKIKKKDEPAGVNGRFWDGDWTIYDSVLTIGTEPGSQWATNDDERLAGTLFHEFTHDFGTDDGESGDDWKDADAIRQIELGSLMNWGPIQTEMTNVRKGHAYCH